jgi:hypothetical protein
MFSESVSRIGFAQLVFYFDLMIAGVSMRLIVSTGKAIVSMDRDGTALREIVSVNAIDVDIDIATQTLFYINKTDKQVSKSV